VGTQFAGTVLVQWGFSWCLYVIEVMVQAAAGTALLIAVSGFAIRPTKTWLQACIAAAVTLIVTSLLIAQS
jgi:hypothetical protein